MFRAWSWEIGVLKGLCFCCSSDLGMLAIAREGPLSSLIAGEVSVVTGAGGPEPSLGLTRPRQRGRLW